MRFWSRRAAKPARAVAYSLTKAARQDIIGIYLQSEERFGEAQADRYLAGLHEMFAFLAENPRAARERIEFAPPVRIHSYKAHLIVYEIERDDILILRLRHGHEDWQASPAAS